MQSVAISQSQRRTRSNLGVNLAIAAIALLFLVPMLLVIAVSLTDESAIVRHGYRLIPRRLSGVAYEMIFRNPERVARAYSITITVTATGTVGGLLLTSMAAYPLSQRRYRLRIPFTFFFFFVMLFSGGLVPYYIFVTRVLHLRDSLLAVILPLMVTPFHILILRTYFRSIHPSLIESATMDGAGEIRIFAQIILPLSTPALATVGLFMTITYWNEWWFSLIFIENRRLYPLQMLLREVMMSVEVLRGEMASNLPQWLVEQVDVPSEAMRMAMCVVAAGPMLIVFPFFQKYFVRGLTIGALKG